VGDVVAGTSSACPRCGEAFHCGANAATPCACGTLRLGEATLQALRERYSGCLCLDCLRQLEAARAEGIRSP
jgi:Cysteine-rich CWC